VIFRLLIPLAISAPGSFFPSRSGRWIAFFFFGTFFSGFQSATHPSRTCLRQQAQSRRCDFFFSQLRLPPSFLFTLKDGYCGFYFPLRLASDVSLFSFLSLFPPLSSFLPLVLAEHLGSTTFCFEELPVISFGDSGRHKVPVRNSLHLLSAPIPFSPLPTLTYWPSS